MAEDHTKTALLLITLSTYILFVIVVMVALFVILER